MFGLSLHPDLHIRLLRCLLRGLQIGCSFEVVLFLAMAEQVLFLRREEGARWHHATDRLSTLLETVDDSGAERLAALDFSVFDANLLVPSPGSDASEDLRELDKRTQIRQWVTCTYIIDSQFILGLDEFLQLTRLCHHNLCLPLPKQTEKCSLDYLHAGKLLQNNKSKNKETLKDASVWLP